MPRTELHAAILPSDSRPEETWGARLEPVLDTILIERLKVGDKVGSFYIPDQAVVQTNIGRVFAVSPGIPDTKCPHRDPTCRVPISVEVGDFVIFPAMMGTDLVWEEDGECYDYTALVEGEVLAKVDYGTS